MTITDDPGMPIQINNFRGPHWFLSNFSPSRIIGAYGIVYKTAEAAFQAGKTDDPVKRQRIADARSPYQAKGLGRQLKLPDDWRVRRNGTMRAVLEYKFANAELLRKLLDTRHAILVEGNVWHDNYWGNCICSKPSCTAPGENWLGRLLMEVRDGRRRG